MVRRAAVLVLAGLLGMLAGCGGSDDLPRADDPVAWAGRLCAAMQPLATVSGRTPEFDRNNPANSQNSMIQYFADASDRAGDSLRGLAAAGPSPIPGGDATATRLTVALQRAQQAYAAARDKLDRLDPSDPVGLSVQLPEVLEGVGEATQAQDLAALGSDPALNDAISKSPSCRMIPKAGAG
jgi:hypothetical protein